MQGALLVLADSAFPSGSHGHSNGLEFAIQSGWVQDAVGLEQWGQTALLHSLLHCDGRALLRCTRELDGEQLLQLNNQLAAMRPGALQRQASAQVGRSFLRSSLAAWGSVIGGNLVPDFLNQEMKHSIDFIQYPLAWGLVCSALEISAIEALKAFLVSAVRQMLQVAVRIMNIGQHEALAVQARLGNYIETLRIDCQIEAMARLESAAFRYDMAGLGHESLERRYFRS